MSTINTNINISANGTNKVKFNKSLSDYSYILSFDLAKQKTGWGLVNIKSNKIEKFGMIILDDKSESAWEDIYDKIVNVLDKTKEFCQRFGGRFFILKERLPNQAGKFSTIATLQNLAQVHTAWELACIKSEVEYYDLDGVHSVSVKAFYKREYGIAKPQKEDIADIVCEHYGFKIGNNPLDITDAIACVQTLTDYKWNEDIKDEIKELKKEEKKYKTEKKKAEIEEEISRLKSLERLEV